MRALSNTQYFKIIQDALVLGYFLSYEHFSFTEEGNLFIKWIDAEIQVSNDNLDEYPFKLIFYINDTPLRFSFDKIESIIDTLRAKLR